MFLPPVETMMDASQIERWREMRESLKALEDDGSDDPWVFHGTSHTAARDIVENGFDPSTSYVYIPGKGPERAGGSVCECVYWTPSFEMANNFAQKHASLSHGFPTFLVSRLSDVIASGIPVPDFSMWSIDYDNDPMMEPRDWRDSLEKLEAIAVVNCRVVNDLQVWSIEPLDVDPYPAVWKANAHFVYDGINPAAAM